MPTLEQVFQREKAWIADCDDVDALIEKIGDWRESLRVAERDGDQLVRMRAGDLVGLARSRVVRIQAGAIREEAAAPAKKATPKFEEPRIEAPAVERVRAPEPPETWPAADSGAARRKASEEAALAVAAKAKADARIAAAEAAKIELQNELLRAQVAAAKRAASAPAAATTAAAKAATPERAVRTKAVAANGGPSPTTTAATATATRQPVPPRTHAPQTKPAAVPLNDNDRYTEADRLALASVGHWPPTPPGHRGAFWSKHDDWPRDWTLTGGDLGRFRGEINLTRAVFAAQLGVPSAVVKDAELSPREKVGPALQIAVRRAMDHAIQARRARREERAGAQAPPESAAAVV